MPGPELKDEDTPIRPSGRGEIPLSVITAVGMGVVLVYVLALVMLRPA